MRLPISLVGLLAVTFVACTHDQRFRDVDMIWHANERKLVRAAKDWNQKDLLESVAFFEATTGIESGLSVTYLGVLPLGIDESLAEWRAWYKRNRRLLYVNPASGEIERSDKAEDD